MSGSASPFRLVDERLHAFPGEAPACAILHRLGPDDSWHGAPAERLELISRGDIVNGILAREARPTAKSGGSGPALLLVVHDAGGSLSSPDLGATASWVGPGLAVVAIDLPLHGQRASAKLSERLIAGVGLRAPDRTFDRTPDRTLDRNEMVLVEEFWRQATIDLVRTVDAVLALGGFDPERIGLLGIGLGADLGAAMLTHDPRPRAAVLMHPAAPSSQDSIAPSQSRAEILRLERALGPERWAPRARAFLASHLGF